MAARFQLLVNGEPLCLVGHDGYGVLSAVVSWCHRNPTAFDPAKSPMSRDEYCTEELKLEIGALDTNMPGGTRDVGWLDRTGPLQLKAGDEVVIRILGPGPFDPPVVAAATNEP